LDLKIDKEARVNFFPNLFKSFLAKN